MKNSFFVLVFTTILFTACNNEDINEPKAIIDQNAISTRSMDDMLYFDNMDNFNKTVELLSNLDDEDREIWMNSNYKGFTSLKNIYDIAMLEAGDLDESKQSFLSYKAKFGKYLYFPNYKDDCGAYLPCTNKVVAMLINPDGYVRIGNENINLKDINTYRQLQEIGEAMYDLDIDNRSIVTRSPNDAPIFAVVKVGEAIGKEYDSGWHKENGKKIRLKCGRQVSKIDSDRRVITPRLHIEISFRKKTWLGWTNYSSKTTTTGTFTGGYVGTINFHKHADSSHDWYQDFQPSGTGGPTLTHGKIMYYSAPIIADLSVNYRGIDKIQKYQFTLDEVRFIGF